MPAMKLTPVLFVEAIEPSLPFWIDRLGFEKQVEVPHGDHLGFVILTRGDVEVMMQSWASISEDVPALAAMPRGTSCSFYVEVDDFDDALRRVKDVPVVVPERTTFYGMREIFVREPGGHVVGLAAKSA